MPRLGLGEELVALIAAARVSTQPSRAPADNLGMLASHPCSGPAEVHAAFLHEHASWYGTICAMVLKFTAEHSKQPQPCPNPERFTPRDRRLYRFVGGRPANEEHFEPQLDRVNGKIKCIHYALSMWATIEQAQRKYNSLAELHDDGTGEIAADRYGNFICEIDIVAADGLTDDPDKDGHVRLHQARGVTFAPRVRRYFNCEYLERVDPAYYTPDDGQAASP